MSLYQLKCTKCEFEEEINCLYEDRKNHKCTKCGAETRNIPQFRGALLTDKAFGYTGIVDERLGWPPVKGRKDWHERMKKKGLVPVTYKDIE